LVAVDSSDNVSSPTLAVEARAFRLTPPSPPEWVEAVWNGSGIHLEWLPSEPGLQPLVQRRRGGSTRWVTVSPWLAPDTVAFDDNSAIVTEENYYRIKVRDVSGNVSVDFVPRLVAALQS
jgi:hypothetical protein